MSMHFKTTELSKKLTHSICGCKKKKKIEKKKVKVTFTYLFSLTYTTLPREDIWKTEWWNKKIIIIIPLILPFLGAKVFLSIFSKHVSQMVNKPSLQAMQIVVNGSSQISATLKTYWKYLSVHITPRLVFIYVDKKNDKAVHTGQPLQETFFLKWQWKNGVSLVAHANFFHSREQRSSKKGGGLATKPMWHVQEKWEARRINFPAVVASSGHMVYIPPYFSCVFFPAGDESRAVTKHYKYLQTSCSCDDRW